MYFVFSSVSVDLTASHASPWVAIIVSKFDSLFFESVVDDTSLFWLFLDGSVICRTCFLIS